MAKKPAYKIAEACKLVDVQPYVLRYWEREFPFLASGESRGGQRLYSEEDVAVIRRIKGLLYEEGYTIAGAKRRLEGELSEGAPPAVAEPAPSRRPAPAPAPRAAPSPGSAARTAGSDGTAGALDTPATERVETLLAGVREALGRSREILRLLASPLDRA